MIRLLADQHIYKLTSFLPSQVHLDQYDPIKGLPGDLNDYDALLVRTVTKINSDTIKQFPEKLSFVGTASSGSDHLDIEFIESNNAVTADSKGCNANAVAEYVSTGMVLWADEFDEDLSKFTVGIVGFGFTGSVLAKRLDKMGIDHINYDPPLAEWDKNFSSASLDELLSCDIISLHIPLTYDGEHATYHWLDEEKLNHSHTRLLINASRGGIIDEAALIETVNKGGLDYYIKDVWEGEPKFDKKIVDHAYLATPHIAGYSQEAKLSATEMVVQKMLNHFGMEGNASRPEVDAGIIPEDLSNLELKELINQMNPIPDYDKDLKSIANTDNRGKDFARLRTSRPFRKEYQHIQLPEECFIKFPVLNSLSFDRK